MYSGIFNMQICNQTQLYKKHDIYLQSNDNLINSFELSPIKVYHICIFHALFTLFAYY